MRIITEVPKITEITQEYKPLQAIFWDMDGTILDTERLHVLSVVTILKEHRVTIDDSIYALKDECSGMSDPQVLKKLHEHKLLLNMTEKEFILRKNKLLAQFLEQDLTEILLPDLKSLIQKIAQSNIKQALITSSEKDQANLMLDRFELKKYFDLILTREDTPLNKPDPMPYNRAKELLEIKEDLKVLIFEDSQTGLEAAIKSKSHVIQVNWY